MEGAELPREPEATPHAASASAGLTLVIELEHCTAPRPTVSLKGTREAYVRHTTSLYTELRSALPADAQLVMLVNSRAPIAAATAAPAPSAHQRQRRGAAWS